VTNQVTVNGGAIANDPTSVAIFTCDLNGDGLVNVADVQTEINVALGVIPRRRRTISITMGGKRGGRPEGDQRRARAGCLY